MFPNDCMGLQELHRLSDSALRERAEVFLEKAPEGLDTLTRGMRKCRRALIAALRRRPGMERILERLSTHSHKQQIQ